MCNAYSDGNCDRSIYGNSDSDSYEHGNANSDCHEYRDRDAYEHCNAYGNGHSDKHGDVYANSLRDCYSFGYCDRNPARNGFIAERIGCEWCPAYDSDHCGRYDRSRHHCI